MARKPKSIAFRQIHTADRTAHRSEKVPARLKLDKGKRWIELDNYSFVISLLVDVWSVSACWDETHWGLNQNGDQVNALEFGKNFSSDVIDAEYNLFLLKKQTVFEAITVGQNPAKIVHIITPYCWFLANIIFFQFCKQKSGRIG